MHLMSCDNPVVQGYRRRIALMKKEMKELRLKAARYDWLEANAKEVLLRPDRVNCDWGAPDLRTKWEIPTLICSGPVGGTISFGEAIDIERKKKQP